MPGYPKTDIELSLLSWQSSFASKATLNMEPSKSHIKFIIPCYNEAGRLNLAAFIDFLDSTSGQNVSFLFVDDGSKDDTKKMLHDFSSRHESIDLLALVKNVGKAEAIRQGFLSVNEQLDYLGYLDADLATPLSEINHFRKIIGEKKRPILIMGSRVGLLGYSEIKRNMTRHYLGRIFATVVSNILQLPIYDTQCGAKIIQAQIAKEVFRDAFISKWLFDVELIFRIKKLKSDYRSRIVEVPLRKWEDKAGSKIAFTYFFQAPFDLIRIFLRYR